MTLTGSLKVRGIARPQWASNQEGCHCLMSQKDSAKVRGIALPPMGIIQSGMWSLFDVTERFSKGEHIINLKFSLIQTNINNKILSF